MLRSEIALPCLAFLATTSVAVAQANIAAMAATEPRLHAAAEPAAIGHGRLLAAAPRWPNTLAQREAVRHSEPIDGLAQATGLAECEGTLRGDGPTYKVLFRTDGVEFVPAFDRRVDTEQPLRLRLSSIARGGTTLLHGVEPAAPAQVADRTVAYRRSATIAEHFDVRPAGVEVSVHFAAPLPGSGDLVVGYAAESALGPCTPAADGTGAAFSRPGVGAITIGGVTGIDADGDTVRGSVRWLDGELQFVLPGEFVATASYPLVLDPLLGTQFASVGTPGDDSAPDICYGPSTVYGIAFRRGYANNSSDILVSLTGTSGPQTLTVVEGGAALGTSPSIAFVKASSRTVVAWVQQTGIFGQRDVLCRVWDGFSTVGPVVSIANSASEEAEVRLAGNNRTGAGNDYALCVYTNVGSGLRGCRIQAPSLTATVVGTFVLQNDADAGQPAISRSHDSAQPYVVTWRSRSLGNWVLRAQAISDTLVLQGARLDVDSNALECADLAVDGFGNDFLVAWDRYESAATLNRDLVTRGLRWNGAALVTASPTTVHAEPGSDQFAPAVGACGKFLVCYASQFPLSTNVDVKARELAADCTTCGNGFVLQGLNTTLAQNIESLPAIATVRSTGGANASDTRALIVFAEIEDTIPFGSTLVAQQYQSFGTATAPTVGTSCGGGTIGRTGGFPQVGNTAFGITLTGAPPAGIPFLLVGFQGGETPCGACTVLNIVAAEFVFGSGSVTKPYPFACSTLPFLGLPLQAQWAILNAGSSPCPLAPGVTFSNRLHRTLQL